MDKTEINFTKNGDFKEFNNSVIKYLLKKKEGKIINIIDYVYPLQELTKNSYEVCNHVNLTGFNPLKGANFISLTNIYISKKGIIICGFKEGVKPSNKEKKILLKANIQAYCYNLVPTVIYAASLGLKVNAYGIVNRQ